MSTKDKPPEEPHRTDGSTNDTIGGGSDESEQSMLSQNQEGDWVDDSLRKLYTSTLEEDIPADMLSLLDQLDEAVEANSDTDEEPNQ